MHVKVVILNKLNTVAIVLDPFTLGYLTPPIAASLSTLKPTKAGISKHHQYVLTLQFKGTKSK